MRNKENEIINWDRCIELANNDASLALELLTIFSSQIETEKIAIVAASKQHNVLELRKLMHGLLGSTSYCDVPYLRKTVINLHEQLHAPYDEPVIKKHIDALFKEIDAFKDAFKKLSDRKSGVL